MAVSVVVQKMGSGAERRREEFRSKLIRTEPQAVFIGVQALRDWYWKRRRRSILTPYRGVLDGDLVSFVCERPHIEGNHKVTAVSIRISKEAGVDVTLEMVGDYVEPTS